MQLSQLLWYCGLPKVSLQLIFKFQIPLIAEQPDNGKMLARHGSAEIYSKHDIPHWEKLNRLLQKMLQHSSYQKAADRLARVLSNQPIKPRELMIKHSEMAAMFGKMPELTPSVQDMSIIEFYNLDIIFLFLIISIGTSVLLWKFLYFVLTDSGSFKSKED